MRNENTNSLRFEMLNAAASIFSPTIARETFSVKDWVNFVLWLDRAKILLPLCSLGFNPPYDVARNIVEAKRLRYIVKQEAIIRQLCALAERAHREQLRFVCMKGAPLAKLLYGDLHGRNYSDIDILVAPQDLAKAGHVANECGFTQPAEYFKLRSSAAFQHEKAPTWEESPFLLRNRADLDSIGVFLKSTERAVIGVDMHDRLAGMNDGRLDYFLWDTSAVEIKGAAINTLSPVPCTAHLIASAYEDSETYMANAGDGMLGLKLYFDLLACLFRFGKDKMLQGFNLLDRCGKTYEAQFVAANLLTLFPVRFDFLANKVSRQSAHPSYLQRLVDVPARKHWACQHALDVLAGPNGCCWLKQDRTALLSWTVGDAVKATCKIAAFKSCIKVQWTIPSAFIPDIDCYVFQANLYGTASDTTIAEVQLNLFSFHGEFECRAKTRKRVSRSGGAYKNIDDIACAIMVERTRGVTCIHASITPTALQLSCESPSNLMVNGGIFSCCNGDIYHEVLRNRLAVNGQPVPITRLR